MKTHKSIKNKWCYKHKMLMLPVRLLKWCKEDHHTSSKITLKISSSRVHHMVLLVLDMLYLLNIKLLCLLKMNPKP